MRLKAASTSLSMLLCMGIELHHLRGFLALADEQHFTRAAERVQVSQPTLSRSLRRLEELLGRRLIERTTRQVTLTEAGKHLYDELSAVLPRLDAALRPDATPSVFRVGFAWGFPAGWTQSTIERFEETTGLAVRLHRRDAALAGVDRGEVDVAILRGRVRAPHLRVVTLLQERRIAAVSVRSDLARREGISWGEIAGQKLVLNRVSGTTCLSDWPKGARPEAAAYCENFDEWIEGVAANQGIGVVPESIGRKHIHPSIIFLPIADAPKVPLHLAYPHKGSHPLAGRFLSLMQEAIGETPARTRRSPPAAG